MGDQTAIGWTNKTYNPWMGCHKVSAGCAHCYMFTEQRRYGNDPNVVRKSKTMFRAPLKWKEPALVFTCSWSDFFIEEADEWRPEVWEIIRQTPHLTYQILTKRPENIAARLPDGWPFANVWLGVSVEYQRFMYRAQEILDIPAAIRFVSAEPLLGPLTFPPDWLQEGEYAWVIVGGESGPKHRPMKLDWARSIRDQCVEAGVPFFFKQDSGALSGRQGRAEDELWRYKQIPEVKRE